MKTEICITIDTEFNIGGAFADPRNRRPIADANVDCPAEGRDNGLPFLLDTFRQYGVTATFFIEAMNTSYFGDGPMGRVVERVLQAGHDVQLHLHPCWTVFESPNWAEDIKRAPPDDRCDGRPDRVEEFIHRGVETLKRFGAPAPIAMRSGNLRADRSTYTALARAGLKLASNIGLAAFRPPEPELHLTGGRHWIGDVLEAPVLTYTQLRLGGKRWPRLLTITACSWREIEGLLWQARGAALSTVVVLTHPFEFIKGDRMEPATLRTNRVNQERLRRLCAFIAAHPDEFTGVSFAQAGPAWLRQGNVPAPDFSVSLGAALTRMVQNKVNDLTNLI